MKTYENPHTDMIGINTLSLLQGQSRSSQLNVYQTTITDANQILSKEAPVDYDLWEESVWESKEE